MKILILDDEPGIRGFLEISMRQSGHEVVLAASGEEALELFSRMPDIEIALLDVMLPGIDGFEVCRRIRATERNVGIIMLTAKSQEMDKVTGLMIGADDYVPKPFSITELLARIESLRRRISGKSQADQNRFCSGEFSIDTETHQLFRNGREITLTQVEYQVLVYFFSNRNKAMSRQEILEGVWGKDYFGDDKIVDVNIRRLRLKIEDDPADPKYLVAVRGFGYKWKC